MTDYERGFGEGFSRALQQMNRARNGACYIEPDASGGKKISVGFRPDQFEFITQHAAELNCSFGAAVRNLVDRARGAPTNKYCDPTFDGNGMECRRCGSWQRGTEPPECPPYVTRVEPDNSRLPHIKTQEENRRLWVTWGAYEDMEHPQPHLHSR